MTATIHFRLQRGPLFLSNSHFYPFLESYYLKFGTNQTKEGKMESHANGSLPSQQSIVKDYQYSRVMGGYKPHFQGLPEDYYPLTCSEVIKYTLYVLFIIGAGLGVMIGFVFWVTGAGLEDYVIVWSIVYLCFFTFLIILFYIGGKGRIREEKRLIIEQQERQDKMRHKANKRRTNELERQRQL